MMAPSTHFAAAYAIDWIAGDPPDMPHPARLIGWAVAAGERCLRRPGDPHNELLRGVALAGTIVAGTWFAAKWIARRGGAGAEIVLGWTALATRSLLDESTAVLHALDSGDVVMARRRLAMIVGRDTANLDEPEILRAVIETIAESLCDGVVAPILYLALGGAPGAMAFKAVSTLDSLVGHREPPYLYFGRAAARLDDVANFIPARVTAGAIAAAAFAVGRNGSGAWSVFRRDGDKHPSPNAGQCEAAMAGALGVRLGGVNYYGGEPSPKPVLGAEGRPPTRADAQAALRIAGVASLAVFCATWFYLRWREKRA